MLADVTYQPESGPAVPGIKVGFAQPDVAMLADLVQSTEYEIEFQTTDMPALKIGEMLDITHPQTLVTDKYKVRRNPEKKGDGMFSKVLLTKL